MAVVSLKIGGRFYKFSCADGQEAYMASLADTLDKRAEGLLKSIGFMQEGQLLAMLCLLLAEEKNKLEKSVQGEAFADLQKSLLTSLTGLTDRINSLSDSLEKN